MNTAHAVDVGRLVVQCTCGHAARWSGEETARLQGWHSRWQEVPRLLRLWTCPECWAARAPVRPSTDTQIALPGYLRDLVLDGKAVLAEEQLELIRPDTGRFAVYLTGIEDLAATELRKGGKLQKMWVGYVRRERRRLTLSMRNR